MSSFATDLRQGIRALARAPGLTLAATATLALAIGLNTAVFSIVNAVVLRPLPFAEPDRILALCELDRGERTDWCSASTPDVRDIAERSRSIEVAGVARSWEFIMRTADGAVGVGGGLATPEAFRALRISPQLGRLLEPGDVGTSWRRVVVLSDDIWRARFGARHDVVGQSITLDGEPHEIVGVLPPGTRIPRLERVQMWRPPHFDPRDEERRDWRGFLAFARLREGATLAQAREEIAAIAAQIQAAHFPAKPGWTVEVRPWHDVVVGPVRPAMYLFLGAVGLVLLIGCANVANLLLARATAREPELALRAALGASRGRLVRGLLAESLVLAVLGAAAGIVLGSWAIQAFVALAPSGIPRLDQTRLDSAVLAFTAALSLTTALLVGVAPALRATRRELHPALSAGGRGALGAPGRSWLGGALIVGEIALAVVLLTGAGLLTRSFAAQVRWAPGFEQDHLLTTWVLASPGKFERGRQVAAFLAGAMEELRAIPSVVSVGAGSAGPLFGGDGEMTLTIDGRPASPTGPRQAALWYDVSPGYFATLGVPVVRGRDILASDVEGAPRVAVVNESFVRRYLARQEPLGRRVHMTEHHAEFTVVGVVRDVPPVRPGEEVRPQIFWSNRQMPRYATYFLVRTAGDPAAVARAIEARLHAYDPEMQVSAVRTMRDWLSADLTRPRFGMTLLATFGLLALALSLVGTYSLLAYTVARRTKEIGIRMALGARQSTVMAAVVGRGMRLAAIGVVLGIIGALGATRLLSSMLAGIGPRDPLTFAAIVLLLLGTAAAACLVPARRASRIDPMKAIRAD
ncbi:MAG TPA: ABC transporter permease [Gemmatimonadaceae bacterium]|nr:ABC transporter permease [Gemmatimonadaceae bacterium]